MIQDQMSYLSLMATRKNEQVKLLKKIINMRMAPAILKDWLEAHVKAIQSINLNYIKFQERLHFYKNFYPSENPSPSQLNKAKPEVKTSEAKTEVAEPIKPVKPDLSKEEQEKLEYERRQKQREARLERLKKAGDKKT